MFYDDMRAGRNIFENRRNHYFHTKSFNFSESSRKINMRHMGFTNFRKFSLIIIFKTCFSPDVSRKNKFKFFGSKVPIIFLLYTSWRSPRPPPDPPKAAPRPPRASSGLGLGQEANWGDSGGAQISKKLIIPVVF